MAARSKLEPGEHSIERSKVRKCVRPSGVKFKRLTWSIRLHGAVKIVRKHTEAPITATDAEVRKKALGVASEMLRVNRATVQWQQGDSFKDFIEAEVRTRVEAAQNISDLTRKAYLDSIGFLLGECEGHSHKKSFADMTIFDGTGLDEITECLQEIAKFHGKETARRSRTVVTGYIIPRLIAKRLLQSNPIQGVRIDLESMAKSPKPGRVGGVALSMDEYQRVYEYLANLDPAEGAVEPARGRWKIEHVIAKRRNAIELTLLQMATGLRISEVRQAWCGLFTETSEGISIYVDPKIAKGGVPRVAHILDKRVADRVRQRLKTAQSPEELFVGAPSDPKKAWTLRATTDELEALYLEMFRELGIGAFEFERSHIWRATLNTMLEADLPASSRAAQFGHSEKVGAQHYIDDALDTLAVRRSQRVFAQ